MIYTVDLKFPKAQNRICCYGVERIEAETKAEAILIATQQAKNDGFKGSPVTQRAQLAREVEA
jgi:hypothetical protein